jgi:hypothetical protein
MLLNSRRLGRGDVSHRSSVQGYFMRRISGRTAAGGHSRPPDLRCMRRCSRAADAALTGERTMPASAELLVPPA